MNKIDRLINYRPAWLATLVSALMAFAVVALISLLCAYFEAKTYNKLTGHHVSTWDALWVDLRVQDSPK